MWRLAIGDANHHSFIQVATGATVQTQYRRPLVAINVPVSTLFRFLSNWMSMGSDCLKLVQMLPILNRYTKNQQPKL